MNYCKNQKNNCKRKSVNLVFQRNSCASKQKKKSIKYWKYAILKFFKWFIWRFGRKAAEKKWSDESAGWTILICFNYSVVFVVCSPNWKSFCVEKLHENLWEMNWNNETLTFFKALKTFFLMNLLVVLKLN